MTVNRRLLGRIPQYDPKNELYPMRLLWTRRGAEPPAIRSNMWRIEERLDQGNEGSCVGHGFTNELLAEPERVTTDNGVPVDHEYARNVYFDAQRLDPWPGGAYPGAEPQYEGTSTLAGAKVMVKRGHYTGYLWAQSEEDIARAVSNDGPVVLGIDWTEDMFNPDQDGFVHPTGAVAGGHCFILIGIDVDGDFYWALNSWGFSWGIGGLFKIRRADVNSLVFGRDGDALIPVRFHVEPVPTPDPTPTPDPVDPQPSCDLWCWIGRIIKWVLSGGR